MVGHCGNGLGGCKCGWPNLKLGLTHLACPPIQSVTRMLISYGSAK
jgi:hypothetical protein